MRSLPYSIYLLSFLVFTKSYSQGFWGNEFPEGKIPYAPRSYVCYTTSLPITLDGKITEEAWKNIPWTDSFIDIEGDENTIMGLPIDKIKDYLKNYE